MSASKMRFPDIDFASDPLPDLHAVLASRFPEMAVCPDERVEILGGVLRGPRSLWVQARDSQTVRS